MNCLAQALPRQRRHSGPAEKYFDPQPAALVRAALAEDAARVRELVAAGVNPNSQGPRSNRKNTPQITLLGYAISQRSEAALRLLIQSGADPLCKPCDGDGNAFGVAIVRKDTEMLDAPGLGSCFTVRLYLPELRARASQRARPLTRCPPGAVVTAVVLGFGPAAAAQLKRKPSNCRESRQPARYLK